jgi:hypothetical protein
MLDEIAARLAEKPPTDAGMIDAPTPLREPIQSDFRDEITHLAPRN